MQTAAKDPAKMVHVNKRRLQSYSEFIQGYKEYKQVTSRQITPKGMTQNTSSAEGSPKALAE